MTELGHVVYYVRSLDESLRFYTQAVGLNLRGTIFGGRGALLAGERTHHELLLIEVGNADGPMQGKRIGLYHVGWKIGEGLRALRAAREKVAALGYPVEGTADHGITWSLYLRDPDGNEVEIYADNPACNWREDDSWIEQPVNPLIL